MRFLYAMLSFAVVLVVLDFVTEARSGAQKPASAYTLALDRPLPIDVRSSPVTWHNGTYYLVRMGEARFHLDESAHLKAALKGSITTFDEVEYDVHAAVLDREGRLLGTARAVCPVERMWLGQVVTMPKTLD